MKNNKRGMTLMEMMIVVFIITLIGGTATYGLVNAVNRSQAEYELSVQHNINFENDAVEIINNYHLTPIPEGQRVSPTPRATATPTPGPTATPVPNGSIYSNGNNNNNNGNGNSGNHVRGAHENLPTGSSSVSIDNQWNGGANLTVRCPDIDPTLYSQITVTFLIDCDTLNPHASGNLSSPHVNVGHMTLTATADQQWKIDQLCGSGIAMQLSGNNFRSVTVTNIDAVYK